MGFDSQCFRHTESEPAEVPGLFAKQSGRRKALRCKPSSLRRSECSRDYTIANRRMRVRLPPAPPLGGRSSIGQSIVSATLVAALPPTPRQRGTSMVPRNEEGAIPSGGSDSI